MKTSELIRHLQRLERDHGDLPVTIPQLLGTARIDRAINGVEFHEGLCSARGDRYPSPQPHLVLLR